MAPLRHRLLNLLTILSLLLCVAACVHWALAGGRDYILFRGSVIVGTTHPKAILWLERQRDPDVIFVMLDHCTTGAGFLYGMLGGAYRVLAVPHWPVVAITLIAPAVWAVGHFRERRLDRMGDRGLCRTCGYDLRATPGRCPECGLPVGPVNA
jgi:hypothetical protein